MRNNLYWLYGINKKNIYNNPNIQGYICSNVNLVNQ